EGASAPGSPQTVFVDSGSCELRAPLLGDKQVLKEAQDIMIQRLTRLDHDTVKRIFRLARFQMMDQKQLGRLRAQSAQNVEEAALDEWTNAFLKREDEVPAARSEERRVG